MHRANAFHRKVVGTGDNATDDPFFVWAHQPRRKRTRSDRKSHCVLHGIRISDTGWCSGNASKGSHILGNKCSVDCVCRTGLQNYIAVSDVPSTDVILYMYMFGIGISRKLNGKRERAAMFPLCLRGRL